MRLGGEGTIPHEEHHLQSTSGANVFADLGVDIEVDERQVVGLGRRATPSLAFRCFDHDLHFFIQAVTLLGDELMIWIMRHYLLKVCIEDSIHINYCQAFKFYLPLIK